MRREREGGGGGGGEGRGGGGGKPLHLSYIKGWKARQLFSREVMISSQGSYDLLLRDRKLHEK